MAATGLQALSLTQTQLTLAENSPKLGCPAQAFGTQALSMSFPGLLGIGVSLLSIVQMSWSST